MTSASYRLFEDNADPDSARVEVVTEVTVEYGLRHTGGDHVVWDTSPRTEKVWPLAERIEGYRVHQGARVFRRRVIVIEDWAEVDGP